MKLTRSMHTRLGVWVTVLIAAVVLAPNLGSAAERAVFQRPSRGKTANTNADAAKFRRGASDPHGATTEEPPAPAAVPASTSGNPLRAATDARVVTTTGQAAADAPHQAHEAAFVQAAQPLAEAPRRIAAAGATHQASRPTFAQPSQDLSGVGQARRSRAIAAASIEPWIEAPTAGALVRQATYCDCGEPTCGICEPACGLGEPGCGMMMEPACGLAEPGCGIVEPGCGIVEPGCGLEPACGCAEPDCGIVGCGSCVGNPGPDYWCFPVCLPRFKDLRFWAGVHGFKGPRDAPLFGGAGDGNFGFQEGLNVGGRAPLISMLFPQLSYQLGYQAVQSQLSGLSSDPTGPATEDADRSQQFVTAGVFRRVNAGVQFGVVWDMLRDDFQIEEDFHQLRYEISLKSKAGREIGFWGASHMNDKGVDGTTYQSVDQYCGFLRCHFRDGGALRFWGGGTNDDEGLFGGDFIAPLNNRWSVQTGFNYLITDRNDGPEGAREESWNVGINLVWHYGFTAKKNQLNPYAPLFATADNGWMFIDETP